MTLETYYDQSAAIPSPGECYCHLLAGHPHTGVNEVCDICKLEAEEATSGISDRTVI